MDAKVLKIIGRAVPVEGNDIDTDRIIPARYLKEITFTNMGSYPFYDERFEATGKLKPHSFNEPQYQGASILFVNKNFGCGSSREHAPQALIRWGVKAIVGESFAEIFAGNCTMLGVPVVTASAEVIHKLIQLVKTDPKALFSVDIDSLTVSVSGVTLKVNMPETKRSALINGTWDTTAMLLANKDKVAKVASQLSYISGYK